uniref:mycocerosic acid synthase n=1 Tax=Oncorhynchus gorbuscha TaxID=8017 RepID=UPI001EAECB8D|nr:mycocerosic acid synthase [Oncorhynchus gorbuscha]
MEDNKDEIAIVGIGCNFPGGEGLDNFWKVLLEGRNCVVDIPDERFDSTYWYDPDDSKPGKTQTTKAALIDGFNEFDHKFFGITEAETDFMDPQHKLLLQCTYRALEDAGMPMEKVSGTRTGVYIGLMNRDYETLLNNRPSTITHYNGTGTAMSVAANRISFIFNLTGPSFAIDSACSSSLVALHSACQAIKQGDCEMALCGGVSCIIEPRVFVALSKAKMISPEGTSKPFSSRADGYGRGEGCGIILLKPLKNALRDFDKVWGIVRRTAVNQDGHTVTPITKPSMVQQVELLHRIYSAESDLSSVQYIEAHGTGTPVGDPIEAGSISKVIAKARPPGSETLCIGSVKGNIGHTESAAGVAGLIKVLLMMKHETIVPSLFYSEDSASIDAKALNVRVPIKAEKWEKTEPMARLAGINSFGFGGTNAHAIVKEYVQGNNTRLTTYDCPKLFVLSAASENSLAMSITDTYQRLSRDKQTDILTLMFTSACRRSHLRHKYRKAFMTFSVPDLENQLQCAMNRKLEPSRSDNRLIFVFCGNGVTYRGMCKQLLKEEPVFREKVREVENLFQNYKSTGISQKIANDFDNDDYTKPDVVQPLLFAIQVGIVSLFKHWGIKPDAVLGHSVGEVAAAHCSGLLSLEDAVKVIYFRSTLQSKVTGGKMLVVSNMAVSEVLKILPIYSGKVCLAAFNSPQSCALSGDADAIDNIHQKLTALFRGKNLFLRVLDVPAAYHSHMMDPIVDHIEESIGSLTANKMDCELFSTVTGDMYTHGDFSTGRYWARNIREPVSFEHTLKAATKDQKNVVFVEIGPRRALQRYVQETLGNDTIVLSSVQPEKDHETMLTTVSKVFEQGVHVDWDKFYEGCEASPTPLPRYQFDNLTKEVYFEAVRQGNEKTASSQHPLMSQTKHESKEHKCNLSSDTAAYLWEHKNNGVAIAPGALYVELAFASIMASSRPKMPICSMQLSVTFQSLFTLSTNSQHLKVVLEATENDTMFKIQSPSATHASGTICCRSGRTLVEEQTICPDVIFKRCKSVVKGEEIYSFLSRAGFEYGPIFRQLDDVHFGDEFKEAVSAIKVSGEVLKQLHEYFLHPVVLDYFLQMTAMVAVGGLTTRPVFPSAIGSVVIAAPLQEDMIMYLRAIQETSDYLDVCGCFSNKDGHVLVELKHVRISFLGNCSHVAESFFFHNELFTITDNTHVSCKPKALIFEDILGVGTALRPYLHQTSFFVLNREFGTNPQVRDLVSHSLQGDAGADSQEVLFMWGIQDLSHLSTEMALECLVDCCEHYRQIVLALKENKCSCTIRVITYRSAETTVDHVSPGFVLSGMTRACAAEIPGLSFQLIDLASVSSEDIQALVHVINTSKHPEVMISRGQIYSTVIVRTPIKGIASSEGTVYSLSSGQFILQTADPYRMTSLSAMPCDVKDNHIQEKSVEIQLSEICVHSSDYFSVSVSDLNFGQTMYWNKHASQNHQLLALDFSGTVTAVGKGVSKLKVGEHVVSCYPIAASSKVVIPEAACYNPKRLPFLKEAPCVSYFLLAWEILYRALPRVKQQRRLAIISSVPDSVLLRVLTQTANKSGWNAIILPQFSGQLLNIDQCNTFVVLPPFDPSVVVRISSGATAKNIVVVCDNQVSSSANIFAHESEHTHIQTLYVSNVFQRANIKAQKTKIHNWLRSLHLDGVSQSLQTITFQSTDTRDPQPTAHCESYFRAKAVSQVVLGHADSENTLSDIPLLMRPRQLFKKSCVYIVTGGLSGLGLETVKFIAHRGGGCIATLSRSPMSAEMQFEMDTLQRRCGVSIMSVQCDVSVSGQVVNAITAIVQMFPSCPIKGVFHSAAVLHDALIETLDRSHFNKVLRPKVNGALNLHYATQHNKLDYFVCYSSISSFIGNASQSNYAAANSFLDTFSHYRRNLGLAGQSINWGPLNLGLLLNRDNFQRFLEAKGMMIMEVSEVHEALEKCLLMNNPQQVICKFNFRNLSNHVLSQNASLRGRLTALVEQELENTNITEPIVQQLSTAHENVRAMLSEITSVSIDEVNDDTALYALGIDSMLAMTLQNYIFQERGVNVPLVKLLDPTTTLSTLVTILEESG